MKLELTEHELDYLTMILKQNIEDYEEEFGGGYKEMVKNLYSKLNNYKEEKK